MPYTTKQGDTWDMISYRVYSDEKHMSLLITANPAHAHTVIFSAGVSLETPAASKSTDTTGLPPWIRASEAV